LPKSWTTFTLSSGLSGFSRQQPPQTQQPQLPTPESRIMEYYRNKQINLDLIGGREENIDV
jgi:hypothetical protein